MADEFGGAAIRVAQMGRPVGPFGLDHAAGGAEERGRLGEFFSIWGEMPQKIPICVRLRTRMAGKL